MVWADGDKLFKLNDGKGIIFCGFAPLFTLMNV